MIDLWHIESVVLESSVKPSL